MQTFSPRKSGLFTPFMGVGIVIIIKSESEIDLNEFENFKNFDLLNSFNFISPPGSILLSKSNSLFFEISIELV